MPCDLDRTQLRRYLEGELAAAEAARVEAHVEACATCQTLRLLDPGFAAFLRQRLPGEAASAALRTRLARSLAAAPAAGEPAPASGWRAWLASPWMPRLAMAVVLALLLLVPVRTFLRAPALAQEAVRSHDFHLPTCDGPLPACCTDLALQPGDLLGPPAAGRPVPDLGPAGLHLIVTSLCAGRVEFTRLCYRDAAGTVFSLYITDRVTEEFQALSPDRASGLVQAHYRVNGSQVSLWEQDGLVHMWVGPRGHSHFQRALEILQRPL